MISKKLIGFDNHWFAVTVYYESPKQLQQKKPTKK
jgi:hypothetical protein